MDKDEVRPPTVNRARRKSLGEILVEENLITAEQLGDALELQRKQGGKLTSILVNQGMVSAGELAAVLSIQLNMPLIDLKRHTVQPDTLRLISEDMARKYTLIPLDIINDSLVVVMADPEDIRAVEDIKAQAKMRVEVALGIPSDIERAIDLNYRSSAEIEKQVSQFAPAAEAEDASVIMARTPIAETLDLLIVQAVKARARPMGMRYMSLVAVFLIAISLLFPVYQVKRQAETETMRLQSELSGVSRELNQARRVSDEAKLVEAAINEITDDVETLKQEHRDILANGGNFANTLKLVTDTLPAQAYFTSIEIAADQITVQGETDTPFTVINYVMALEAQEGFSEVRIIEIGEARPVETEGSETEAADAGINVITFDIVISQ